MKDDDKLKQIIGQLIEDLPNLAGVVALGIRRHLPKNSRGLVLICVTEWSPSLNQQVLLALSTLQQRPGKLRAAASKDLIRYVRTGVFDTVPVAAPVDCVQIGARIALDGKAADGTLGALLTDGVDTYLLSCRHVLDGRPGDPVVLRQSNGQDQRIAKIVRLSNWALGLKTGSNTTDFALARLNDEIDVCPPPGNPQLAPQPSTSSDPPASLVPLSNLNLQVSRIDKVELAPAVQFPYGQISLSKMWLLHSPDPSVLLAQHGDSGSLWVSRSDSQLIPAAITVAISQEWTELGDDGSPISADSFKAEPTTGTGPRKPSPAVLACPVSNIFAEADFPVLIFATPGSSGSSSVCPPGSAKPMAPPYSRTVAARIPPKKSK